MPAPSLDLIIDGTAPPLNPVLPWPFKIDEFPADALLGPLTGHAPKAEPRDPAANPNRKEAA